MSDGDQVEGSVVRRQPKGVPDLLIVEGTDRHGPQIHGHGLEQQIPRRVAMASSREVSPVSRGDGRDTAPAS